jgi:lipooligosaccharide transport system permease protein
MATYRRVWRGTVFSSFFMPVLFFLGMGISVGSYVDRAGTLGVPYLDYIAPGLLASSTFQVAFGEGTFPVLGSFRWTRIYYGMIASPLRPRDLVAGELLFGAFRALTVGVGFLAVMTAFGVVHSWWGIATLAVAVLGGFAAMAPVLAYSATINSDNMFALLFRFVVIPMTLFAGVFFPVDSLPTLPRLLAYASPLWHLVVLDRAATLGTPMPWGWSGHVAYLIAWAAGGYLLARRAYAKRLQD